MHKTLIALLAGAALTLPATAQVSNLPSFPDVPGQTVVGNSGLVPAPAESIPFAQLRAVLSSSTSLPIFTPVTNNAAGIQSAINQAAATPAGGGVVFVTQNSNLEAPLVMPSNVRLVCSSKAVTLTLNPHVNADVIVGTSAYTLFGTATVGGITKWSIEQCTIDGNSTNQSAPATCPDGSGGSAECLNGIAVYGNDYVLRDVTIQNVAGHFIRMDGRVSGATIPNTIRLEHVLGKNSGRDGILCNGPSDGSYSNVTIVDAGQSADNTYMGVEAGGVCTGDWSYYHGYHSSTATNRVKYQFENNSSGTIKHTLSNFEGGRQELHAKAAAINCGACEFYAPFGTSKALVDLDVGSNILTGRFVGTSAQANWAVSIGPNSSSANNVIYGIFNNFDVSSPFNFATDGGNNLIAGTGSTSNAGGATSVSGTIAGTSQLNYRQTGSTAFFQLQGGVTDTVICSVGPTANNATTSNNTEQNLGNCKIPAGTVGPNGTIRVRAMFTVTGSTNTKDLIIRYTTSSGATSGTTCLLANETTSANTADVREIMITNKGSVSSQICGVTGGVIGGSASASPALNNGTTDTWININANAVTSPDVITLVAFVVEVLTTGQ